MLFSVDNSGTCANGQRQKSNTLTAATSQKPDWQHAKYCVSFISADDSLRHSRVSFLASKSNDMSLASKSGDMLLSLSDNYAEQADSR